MGGGGSRAFDPCEAMAGAVKDDEDPWRDRGFALILLGGSFGGVSAGAGGSGTADMLALIAERIQRNGNETLGERVLDVEADPKPSRLPHASN